MTSAAGPADEPGWRRRVLSRLPMPLTHQVPIHHLETAGVVRRRRRVVAGVSVLGAGLLGVSLSTRPGSRQFYGSAMGVAAVWTVGGLASGPLHLGWIQFRDETIRRPVVTPVLTGVAAFGFFYGAALVARRIPTLDDGLVNILRFAEQGSGRLVLFTTLLNGAGEEVFFRGALYAALGRERPVAASTAVYALATATTRNPALVLAAGVMGTLFGYQRRATGGLQAPMLTHLTWSTLMVRYLPRLFHRARRNDGPMTLAVPGRGRPKAAGVEGEVSRVSPASGSADVVVVGAGLAGLACATTLLRAGLDVVVVEASDAVGGRVRTDVVDGFRLDRGFQVLNTGYPGSAGSSTWRPSTYGRSTQRCCFTSTVGWSGWRTRSSNPRTCSARSQHRSEVRSPRPR